MRLKHILEQAPAPMAVLRGPSQIFELANQEYLRAIGGRAVLGVPVRAAFPELEGQGFFELLDRVYRTGEPHHEDEARVLLDRSGTGASEEMFFNFAYQALTNDAGQVDGILIHAVDVTEHVRTRRLLEEQATELEVQAQTLQEQIRELEYNERQFRSLAESIPQLAWMAYADGFIFWYNQRWYEYTGTTPEDMEGWKWQSVHDPEALPGVLERWRGSIASGQPFDMEFPLRRADGVFRWFLTRVMPVRDDQGKVVRWFGTNTDIEEPRQLLRAAQEARTAAEEANRMKSEFLSTMSHELRTPLNAIAGYVDLLDLGIRGPITEPQRDDLVRIRKAQRHLLGLINDVLNFARIEAGRLEIKNEPVRVADVIVDLESYIAPQLAEKNLRYVCESDAPDLCALGDADRIAQILLNLVSNAVKFTEAGGRISVQARAQGELVEIDIADTGRGIPEDQLTTIFEPFFQVNRKRMETSQQGVGLGLSISRDLARTMNGDLMVRSREGAGSTFTLRLPRAEGKR